MFVAIGGGGLIAGIAAYVKALHPGVKVIGVEPAGAPHCRAGVLASQLRTCLKPVGVMYLLWKCDLGPHSSGPCSWLLARSARMLLHLHMLFR